MTRDFRQALRLLVRAPAFSALVCLTLAISVAAATAVISVVDGAVFRPLPYRDSARLVEILSVVRQGTPNEGRLSGISADRLAALRAQEQVFEQVATFSGARLLPQGDGNGDGYWTGQLSPGFLEFLGLSPIVGRSFSSLDARDDDAVMLSDGVWNRDFGKDPKVVGKQITIGGRLRTVIGVAPATLRYFVSGVVPTDAWIAVDERDGALSVARLRTGLRLDQAQRALHAAVASEPMFHAEDWEVRNGLAGAKPVLELRAIDQERRRSTASSALLLLAGSVAFLFVIACANVASLILSRSFARRAETYVRYALGASPFQIVRHFMAEAIVLAGVGGLGALALAWWTVAAIPHLVPTRALAYTLFSAFSPQVDTRLVLITLTLTLGAMSLCAVAPLLNTRQKDATAVLGGFSRLAGPSRTQRRAQEVLLAAQVATSLMLATGAGLMTRSVVMMADTKPGFSIDDLYYVTASLPSAGFELKANQDEEFGAFVARVQKLPATVAVTVGTVPSTGSIGNRLDIESRQSTSNTGPHVAVHVVADDYFRSLNITLRAGREFALQDHGGAAPLVALVDEVTARTYFPAANAIGERVRTGPFGPWMTVVGIVGKVKTATFTELGSGEIYTPLSQQRTAPTRTLLVRLKPGASLDLRSLREVASSVDSHLIFRALGSAADMYADTVGPPRFYSVWMILFSVIGLLTTAMGLYGLVSASVTARRHEIGVRMALGAKAGALIRLVVQETLAPVLAGLFIGLGGTFLTGRLLTRLLFQVTPRDPVTIATTLLLVGGIAAAAAFVPIRRATRADPVAALRSSE